MLMTLSTLKQRLLSFLLLLPLPLSAQSERQAPVLSGIVDTTASVIVGKDSRSINLEEYAALRLQTKIRERATFNAAFNLIALSGAQVAAAAASGVVIGENYAAALELERLSVRINGDLFDTDLGLMRLAFGYGNVFAPSDFLNPRNPLSPNARARGRLGAAFSAYPTDDSRLHLFAAAPQDAFLSDGAAYLFGVSFDQHWRGASVQALYVFEMPDGGKESGVHRAGLSTKADVLVGLVADALYVSNPAGKASSGLDGLSASAGFDYSFFSGDLYLLAEYLFNGATSITADPALQYGTHNLYVLLRYGFNDFTSATIACMAVVEEGSFTPLFTVEHEVFQGFSLSLQGQLAIERKRYAIIGQARLKF
jgi:hypothetical protein